MGTRLEEVAEGRNRSMKSGTGAEAHTDSTTLRGPWRAALPRWCMHLWRYDPLEPADSQVDQEDSD